MNIFETNIRAIAEKDALLALKLRDAAPSVELEAGKGGEWTFRHSGRYFHSRYDPWKEAEAQCEDLLKKKSDWLILFGLGCGYLLKTLIRQGREKVIVYEPDLGILRAVAEKVDLSDALSKKYVFLCDGLDTLSVLMREHTEGIDDLATFQSQPYKEAFPQKLIDFMNKVKHTHMINKILIITETSSYNLWISNYLENIKSFHECGLVDSLKERFKGVPLVIAGAGPSLKKNGHLLREVKGKALIIAAITAYKPLLELGVIPDFVIAAEKVDLPEYFTYDERDRKTRLLLADISHPNMFKRDVKDKFLYFNAYNRMSVAHSGLWGAAYQAVSGGSVTTMAFDMGIMCGCDPIVFVGQDLAFTGGRTHATGSIYVEQEIKFDKESGKVTIDEDFVNSRMEMDKLRNDYDLLWLKGLDGRPIASKFDWVTFHQWFENHMRYLRSEGFKGTVINATEGGAFIEGMEHAALGDTIERHIREERPIEALIEEAKAARPAVDYAALYRNFSEMGSALEGIRKTSQKIIKEAEAALKTLEGSGLSSGLSKGIAKIKRLEKELFDLLGNAGFIWEAVADHTYKLKEYLRQDGGTTEKSFEMDLKVLIESYKAINATCSRYLPVVKDRAGYLSAQKDCPAPLKSANG